VYVRVFQTEEPYHASTSSTNSTISLDITLVPGATCAGSMISSAATVASGVLLLLRVDMKLQERA
jgi:hypothetical protein